MTTRESWFTRLLNQFKPQKYESEFTQFLSEFKQQRPQIEEGQRQSRLIWWDKPQDLETQQRAQDSRVKQQAYVYQNKV